MKQGQQNQAIAIIGMGCRYPGAQDIHSLWRLLRAAESAVTEIPAYRFGPVDDIYDPRPATPGRIMSRFGGFLDHIENFDADFFGISPMEARQLDPQQRILLEVAWEALEDAGIPAGRLSGSSAGVFIGSWLQDFETRLIGDPLADDLRQIDLYTTTGSGRYPLAGRISYFLGLQGPSLVVDTACSSSLVAIHLACRSLIQNECEIALAGGINILLTPYITVAYSQSRMMAPDGRCKFGDASADGYVRSEGCGVVILKPLDKALADGDSVYAVIHGSAVNNDGRTSGYLTTPGGDGQKDVLQKAYRNAGISPNQVQYVEAHGTGTLAGDPVELGALGMVLSEGRAPDETCMVGSIKTNLGHTEGAAGVAGLIKVALSIKNGEIPASLNHIDPNPNVPWEQLNLKIPTRLMRWPKEHGAMVAGVSAFGITGTNAHIVLGEAPALRQAKSERRPASGRIAGKWIFPLSAQAPEALRQMAGQVHDRLASMQDASIEDMCSTAALNREHLDFRMAVVTDGLSELQDGLAAFARGEERSFVYNTDRVQPAGKIAFVYPGQGSQWLGMCRKLMQHSEIFHETLRRCEAALEPYVDWSLMQQLSASETESRLNDISVIQPVLFAIQVALTEQWKAWGVIADAVIGHSMGEPAAAHAAGILDLDSAARIITARSRLMKRTSGRGAMALVELTIEQAAAEIGGLEDLLSIAVSNSPRSTVLSGDPAALEEVLARCEQRNVFCRKINVDVASHSPQMEPLRGELVTELKGLKPRSASVPIYSTVAGNLLEGNAFNASYWGDNLRQPVRFAETAARMLADGATTFIEMSPHPVLLRAIDECASAGLAGGAQAHTLPSLLRKEDEPATLLRSLGRLFTLGHPVDWRGLYDPPERRISFPPYAWQRERHWFEEAKGQTRPRMITGRSGDGRRRHLFLDLYIQSSLHSDVHLWESELSIDRMPWLADHTVQGHVILPAAAYIELAAAAAGEALEGAVELVDVEFREALFVERHNPKRLQVVMSGDSAANRVLRIFARSMDGAGKFGPWREHASAKVAQREEPPALVQDIETIRTRCDRLIPADVHYKTMQRHQIGYGPAFRGIERIGQGADEAVARIRAPQVIAADSNLFRLHPALLDAGLQLLVSLAAGESGGRIGAWMPVSIGSARIFVSSTAADELWAVARRTAMLGEERFTGDLFLAGPDGRTFAEARGVVLQKIAYTLDEDVDHWLYQMVWPERPLAIRGDEHDFLTKPGEIEKRVTAGPLPNQIQLDAMTASELLPKIEKLCIEYIVSALVKSGLRFETDQTFTADELMERLHIQSRHRRFLSRLLTFLQEEGILLSSGGALRVARTDSVGDPRLSEEKLISQYAQCRTELNLLRRCGSHLAEALTGAVDPLELLFSGGSFEEAEAFYSDSVFARAANYQAGLALHEAIERLPADRTLKILEIGAGTGGLTTHLLPLLPPERTRYTFTDIGSAFVSRAQEKYISMPWLEFMVLDIEKDPVSQGFPVQTYDIVVSANCLHATRDIRTTLSHARKLLAPGGLMLLIEGTRAQRWIDLIFGLTEGWWRFEDFDRRPGHPLMGADAWKKAAAEAGFIDAVVFSKISPMLYDQSIVAARKPVCTDRMLRNDQEKGSWLIFADHGGTGKALATALHARGDTCQLVFRGSDLDLGQVDEDHIAPLDPNHYTQIIRRFDSSSNSNRRSFLFLWPLDEFPGEPPSLDHLHESQKNSCGGLLLLAQALAAREDRHTRLWVISRRALSTAPDDSPVSPGAYALSGLVKVINLEHPELRCRGVDLDLDSEHEIDQLLAELSSEDDESLTAYREGVRRVPRIIRSCDRSARDDGWLPLPENQPVRLVNETRGTLDGLNFHPVAYTPPGPNQVTIQVRAAGLNFRDVVSALGLISDNDDPGLECAGRVVELGRGVEHLNVGDDVVAVAPGAFATYVTADVRLVLGKPDDMTFEQAAAIPIAFLTAYHGLFELAGLEKGEKVLIHAASGGVGMAAVALAKQCGAEIFGTAGTPRKRAFLASIGVDHVLDSRSLDFADQVRRLTQGTGVDVVLNSLSGEFIVKSFAALRKGGRFIEIGKRDIWTPEQARASRPDALYAFFDLAAMAADHPERLRPAFESLMEKFRSRELAPLPATVLPMETIVRAYRTMQQARHIGKIVVNQPPWSGGKAIDAPEAFDSRGTYLITGAFGGIGPELTKWLFERGVRHLALISRGEPPDSIVGCMAELSRAGAQIQTLVCNVAAPEEVEALFAGPLAEMPPLRGVFHLAGALEDHALVQQSWSGFEKVLSPKVLGAWNLHRQTRHLALDCFVLFSSWSSFLGSPGQANHSAANAFLDAIAHQRRVAGLPALSINWGAWAEIGAASKGDVAEHLMRRGIGSFSPEMGFRAMGRLMSQGAVQVAVTPFNLKLWRNSTPATARSTWFEFLDTGTGDSPDHDLDAGKPDKPLLDNLRESLSETDRLKVMEDFLKSQVAQTLRLPLGRVDANKPFKSYGMDSLTALEFRNRIEAATGTTLSATLVFNYPTIKQLETFLLEKLQDSIGGAANAVHSETGGDLDEEQLGILLDEVEKLSEEEARKLLNDEH